MRARFHRSPGRSRRGRSGASTTRTRGGLWLALAFAACGAVLVLAAWLALQTDPVAHWMAQRVAPRLDAAIPGSVEMEALRLRPDLAVRAEGVVVRTPGGEPALRIEHATVFVAPRSLLRGRIDAYVDADGVVADLTTSSDGRPAIVDALSPRTTNPAQVPPPLPATSPALSIHASLERVQVLRRDARHPLSARSGRAGAALVLAGSRWSLDVTALFSLETPEPRPVALRASIAGGSGSPVAITSARLSSAGSRIALGGVRLAMEPREMAGRISMRATPADVAALTGIRPRAAIALTAAATPLGDRLAAALHARIDGGGSLAGVVSLDAHERVRGNLVFDGIDPARWSGGRAPAGDLSGAVALSRAPDGALALRVAAAHGSIGPATIEEARANVVRTASGTTRATVERLAARAPDGETWRVRRTAQVTLRGTRLDLRNLSLSGPGKQRLVANGRYPPTPEHPLVLRAHAVRLPGTIAELVPSLRPLHGTLNGEVRVESLAGSMPREARGWMRILGTSWNGHPFGDVLATAQVHDRRANAVVDARGPGPQRFRLQAAGPLRIPRPGDHATLIASATGYRLAALHDVGGAVRAGYAGDRFWILVDGTSREGTLASIAGAGSLDPSAIARAGMRALLTSPPPLALAIHRLELAPLADAGLLPAGTAGRLTGSLAVGADGRAHARLFTTNAHWRDLRAARLELAGETDFDTGHLFARVRGATGAEGTIGATARRVTGGDGDRTRARGRGVEGIAWSVRAALASVLLGTASPGKAPPEMLTSGSVGGTLDGALALSGTGLRPAGWAYLDTNELSIAERPLGHLSLGAHLSPEETSLWIGGRPTTGGRLALFTRLAMSAARLPSAWRRAPLFAALVAFDTPLDPLTALLPEGSSVGGLFEARAVVRGTAGAPVPRARLAVHEGEIRHPLVGTLHGIELAAHGDDRQFVVDSLRAHGGRGTMDLSAVATHLPHPVGAWQMTAALKAHRFRISGERLAGTIDADGHLDARYAPRAVEATLRLASGSVTLPEVPTKPAQDLAPNPDIVILEPGGGPTEEVAVRGRERPPPTRSLTLRMIAPENLWLHGSDLDLEARGDVTYRAGLGVPSPQFSGEAEAVRGKMTFAGKSFTLQQARIGFPGAPLRDASLDIRAAHEETANPSVKQVYATVTGTIRKPRVALTSEPPLPQNAILSVLFLGSTSPRERAPTESTSVAGRAATFVGNFFTAQIRKQLQSVIPVDVLELEPGRPSSPETARFRVGKYIAPGLFLAYAHNFGGAIPGAPSNALELQYRFEKVWKLLGEYTDENQASLQLRWSRDF